MALTDPAAHEAWLNPHSQEWYDQLSKQQATYSYPWDSTISFPSGEDILKKEVLQMIRNQAVLDIGCGDGAFAKECSQYAKVIVGIDSADLFVQTGNSCSPTNTRFVLANTKFPLPFPKDTFDCAYNRKGPTSSYPLLSEVVKKGGTVIGMHPGDAHGKELAKWFPNFFLEEKETPILDKLERQLSKSRFFRCDIEEVQSTEYFTTPSDVVKYRCFGQTKTLLDDVAKKELPEITKIFALYSKTKGIPITHSRYIVRAVI